MDTYTVIISLVVLTFLVLLAVMLKSIVGELVSDPRARWAVFLIFLVLGLACFVYGFIYRGFMCGIRIM